MCLTIEMCSKYSRQQLSCIFQNSFTNLNISNLKHTQQYYPSSSHNHQHLKIHSHNSTINNIIQSNITLFSSTTFKIHSSQIIIHTIHPHYQHQTPKNIQQPLKTQHNLHYTKQTPTKTTKPSHKHPNINTQQKTTHKHSQIHQQHQHNLTKTNNPISSKIHQFCKSNKTQQTTQFQNVTIITTLNVAIASYNNRKLTSN